MLCPFLARDCLLKFSWCWTVHLPIRTPWIQHQRCQNGLLAPKHKVSIQPIDQGVRRTFKVHYTWYSTERIVNAMEENPGRTWKSGKITPLAMSSVTEKAVKAIKPKIPAGENSRCAWPQDLRQSQLRNPWKRLWISPPRAPPKKCVWVGVQDKDLGKIQELIDTATEKLTIKLTKMSASSSVLMMRKKTEAAAPENKLSLDNRRSVPSSYSRLLLTSLTTWTLPWHGHWN